MILQDSRITKKAMSEASESCGGTSMVILRTESWKMGQFSKRGRDYKTLIMRKKVFRTRGKKFGPCGGVGESPAMRGSKSRGAL